MLKAGSILINKNDASPLLSIAFSHSMPVSHGFYREIELIQSVKGGQYQSDGTNSNYSVSAASIYAGFRHDLGANIYTQFKAGVLYEHIGSSGESGGGAYHVDGIGAAGGIAIGALFGKSQLQLEYTIIEKSAALLSMGYSW